MLTPAPTLAPDAQPIDIIVEYLRRDDPVPVELWNWCADEWSNKCYAFDPEHYFTGSTPTITEPLVIPLEDDDEAEDDGEDADELENLATEEPELIPDVDNVPVERTLNDPEVREKLVIYGPLIEALKTFWTEMIVFTEDNPSVPQWQNMLAAVERFISFRPVDRDRLIRHVHRMHAARLEADALRPKTHHLHSGSVLFNIQNGVME